MYEGGGGRGRECQGSVDLTNADKVIDTGLLPFEEVTSLPTAEVQYVEITFESGLVNAFLDDNALHKITHIPHVENRAINPRPLSSFR